MQTAGSEFLIFDANLKEERDYWLQKLPAAGGAFGPPVDSTGGDGDTSSDSVAVTWDGELYQRLVALTGASAFLLYTTVFAAVGVCLYKYTGNRQLVIGSPALKELDRANALAITDDLDSQLSFKQWLLHLRQVLLAAYARQRYPFRRLLEDLALEAAAGRCPLFDVAVILQDIHGDWPDVHNALTITLARQPAAVSGQIQFQRGLYTREGVKRFRDHIAQVLAEALRNPNTPIRNLVMLTEAERHQLLNTWNDTRVDVPGVCVHQLFERQAARTPDAVAVVCQNERLTYRELDRRADRLAQYLCAAGVGPETCVAICIDHSLDLIVGVLGVLKAGGAYLPLDPDYPAERLAFLLQDAQAPLVLTQTSLAPRLPARPARLICLDADWPAISQHRAEGVPSGVTPNNLAYVIYTSGSSGQPKGVMVPHRGLVNYLNWCCDAYQVAQGCGAPVHSPIGFDLTITSLFSPLLVGQSVTLLPAHQGVEGLSAALLEAKSFSLVKITPAHLQVLAHVLPPAAVSQRTRALIIGGEALLGEQVRFWQNYAPGTRLINEYGPTETVVGCCVYEVPAGASVMERVPIGSPIANTQLYLLDAHLQLAPVGAIAELYVGGYGVARGYLERPALTAERFIPDPFSRELGARLYKTGDLARRRPDGTLDFLGRTDHQVKVRGYRIELGEVETALSKHPALRENVVIVREDAPGDRRLVAYVVPARAEAPSAGDLQRFLREQLPDYMLPSAFVSLNGLPLTPNGKVDRRLLPAPGGGRPDLTGVFVAPRTPVEEILADIWAEVLGVEQVGIRDNFFDLGGHSLLAMIALSRLRSYFKVELPLRTLFDRPTIAELAVALEHAPGEARPVDVPPPAPRPRTGELPLSFAQQRQWFLNQLLPDSPFDNVYTVLRLTGTLNHTALEAAFSEVIRRHEVLRTTFTSVAGKPHQVITGAYALTIPVLDVRHLPDAERAAKVKQLVGEEGRRPFALDTGPLLRVTLVWLQAGAAEEYLLLLNVHHIVSDAWSVGILIGEIKELYTAHLAGRPASLADLPIQYADFAAWQREQLWPLIQETQLAYWRQHLSGSLPVLQLPGDRPRPAVNTYAGASQSFQLPATLAVALKQLGRQHGATLFMTLLAAFKTLLARYSGQHDILVGTPIANRHYPGVDRLIGFFVNTLVIRTDLSGNPTFRDLLARVREVTLDAYAHQDLSFDKLVEELQPKRDMSHTPVFQVMFHLQTVPLPELDFPGLAAHAVGAHNRTARFDLTLDMQEAGEALAGELEYSTDLFEPETVGRMLAHFQTLLEQVVIDPGRPILDLPLLPTAERRQLLETWVDITGDGVDGRCVHQLFEHCAGQRPDAVAVVFKDEALTYGELNRRAEQLAGYLRALGVGPDVPVAVCLERSAEMVIGLIGILKAGGCYAPLDPAYPQERLAFILDDTRAPVLLTHGRRSAQFSQHPTRVVCLDTEWGAVAQLPPANPASGVTPDNLMYVIHTSGSTGRPKGVSIPHRAVTNFLSAMRQRPGLTERDVLLSVTTLSFDIAGLELFLPLTSDARVELAGREVAADGQRLAGQLARGGATVMQATPATWRLLLSAGWPGNPGLKILCGGEAFPRELAAELLARSAAVWNLYGPTETTIWSATGRLQVEDGPVTLDRPIANTQLYLLDTQAQPAPVGVPGELFIGGAGLARGYFNRPDLTAEKFVPHPFSAQPGARLYRTGDLARHLPGGRLEFLGRLDHQVKLRGFRIELGEIEAALRQRAGVRDAVVLAREGPPGEKRLVAYLVLQAEPAPAADELRRFLKEKLPDYMLPSEYVFLETLPLTPNGKLDRRALPAPERARPDPATFEPPRTPIEATLADIWAEVLNLTQVGVHADFFELGGHSLLATQVISRVCETFQIDLPVRQLFETPTLEGLAEAIIRYEIENADVETLTELLAEFDPVSGNPGQPLTAALRSPR